MLKKLFLISGLLLGAFYARACDVCGCSVGGNYLGILPQFRQHFIGVRYQYQSFTSEHPPLFDATEAIVSEEYFHTAELWGRFYPHPRIQVFAFIPFHRYEKKEDGHFLANKGLGDISLLANYVVFDTGDSLMNILKHSFQVGGGIKLPTGKNDFHRENEEPIANMQPGTGSVDAIFNAIYTVRYGRLGLNNELSYRWNTVSNRDYKFGDRFSAAMRLFFWQNAGKLTLLPQAGAQFEYARKDYINYHNREIQDLSGGSRWFFTAGADAYFGNFAAGVSWRKPVHQDFAGGNIKSRDNLSLHFIYMF